MRVRVRVPREGQAVSDCRNRHLATAQPPKAAEVVPSPQPPRCYQPLALQAVRSLEGQLVRVAKDCTQRLEDGIKRVEAGIALVYNKAAHAHNRGQRYPSYNRSSTGGTLPLLPLRNCKGELPPAGACILVAILVWLRLVHLGGVTD